MPCQYISVPNVAVRQRKNSTMSAPCAIDWYVHKRIWPGLGLGSSMRLVQPPAPDCCSMIANVAEMPRVMLRFQLQRRSSNGSGPVSGHKVAKSGYESYEKKS